MTTEQLLKLVDAGFSKEEILKIASLPTAQEQEKPAAAEQGAAAPEAPAAAPEAPQQEDTKNENQDISKMVEDKINEVFEPFKDLYTNMAKMAGMPSIQDVQPKGIEDIISDFFKGE